MVDEVQFPIQRLADKLSQLTASERSEKNVLFIYLTELL